MTREEWRRIKAVAAEAWGRPSSERALFVAAACAGDAKLRSEVERLLQSADTATDLYEDPLWPAAADFATAFDEVTAGAPPLIGMRVGPYRIVRELGRGGMGQVYLAERVDGEFEQRVAVKFVSNLPTTALLQRFRAERRILATLDHPNIARLMDGGATPDGHPYLVMEYVAGVPIDEFCVASGATINQRLELVRRVCDAVQYAHQHLVIHRDLKPRNILVTADGTPKLLDFGIAKLLDTELPTVESTRTMFRLVTPETASPEQVRGEPITTATDVYALGGLLYRLLTGQTAYEIQPPTDAEWMRAICEQVPVAPSRRVDRRNQGGRESQSIDRDIDLIVLKALRKEPERRYATVSELSEDLKRYLGGRPIQAAPDDRLYRARKFIGRNRVGLAAAVAVGVALTAGTLATARQAQIAGRERARAQGRFDDVRQLANAYMFEVHDAIQTLPGSTPVRRLMITRVLEYLEKLGRDANAESQLQLEIATAYQKVGSVQGNPYFPNVGDVAGAMHSYRTALALSQSLVDRDPNATNRAALAASHHLVADMLWAKGSFPDALQHYRVAVVLRQSLSDSDIDSESRRFDLAASYYGVGQTLLRTGDYDGSVEAFSRAQALWIDAGKRNPTSIPARRGLATTSAKLGDVLGAKGAYQQALEYHSDAARTLRELTTLDPTNLTMRRSLAMLLYRVSNDQNQIEDFQGSLASGREALDLENPILASDPSNAQALTDTALTHRVLGDAFIGLNQPREALVHLSAAEKTLRTALAGSPDNAEQAIELANILISRGDVLMGLKDGPPARQAFRDATTILDAHTSRAETTRFRAIVHQHAGDLERQLAGSAPAATAAEFLRAACRHYQQGLRVLEPLSGQAGDLRNAEEITILSSKLADCSGVQLLR